MMIDSSVASKPLDIRLFFPKGVNATVQSFLENQQISCYVPEQIEQQ